MVALGSHASYLEQVYVGCITSAGLELPNLEVDQNTQLTTSRTPQEIREFAGYFTHLVKKTTYLEECFDTYVDSYDHRLDSVVPTSTKTKQRELWILATIAYGQANIQHPVVSTKGVSRGTMSELGVVFKLLKIPIGAYVLPLSNQGVLVYHQMTS